MHSKTLISTTVLAATAAVVTLAPATDSPNHDHEHVGGRYGSRFATEVPANAVFDELPAEYSGQIAFDPLVTEIVALLNEADYTNMLRTLTGVDPANVDGTDIKFLTRYSTSSQGALSWEYALEQLAQLGFEVSFHEYSQSGNDLKNVVATLPGTVTPNEVYVLGGHIDSISENPTVLAPGAEDNASGSSAVLTAARALAGYAFESTIDLVLFSGEEQGLWGSTAYVNDALAEGRDVKAAVTFDMVANFQTDYGVLIEGEPPWSDLMDVMADAVDTYTDISRQFSYFSFGSDHVPFQDRGIPAILCIDLDWDEYSDYHRTTDTFDKTEPDLGTKIARAGLATIAQLAVPSGTAASVPTSSDGPDRLALGPNPAQTYTTIALSRDLEGEEAVVVNPSGRRVRSLGRVEAGRRRLVWNLLDDAGTPVPTGVYWIRAGQASTRLVVTR